MLGKLALLNLLFRPRDPYAALLTGGSERRLCWGTEVRAHTEGTPVQGDDSVAPFHTHSEDEDRTVGGHLGHRYSFATKYS